MQMDEEGMQVAGTLHFKSSKRCGVIFEKGIKQQKLD